MPTKTLLFDLLGTCTNWHPSIVAALESAPSIPQLPPSSLPQLASDWRATFFKEIADMRDAGLPAEDIDVTHARALDQLLLQRGVQPKHWDRGVRDGLVRAWHSQEGE